MIKTLTNLWQDYQKLCPQAGQVHAILGQKYKKVWNDHLALRTYDCPGIALADLAEPFERMGYQAMETYSFPEKHLEACYFLHPLPEFPKIFISELIREAFSKGFQKKVEALASQARAKIKAEGLNLPLRPWQISHKEYQLMLKESEYGAWVGAFGLAANHFTVFINHLEGSPSLEEVVEVLEKAGFAFNQMGGKIKGSQEVFLKQASTLSPLVEWEFADGKFQIPGSYVEFAQRFPMNDQGNLYQGFVAASADKIFESTNLEHPNRSRGKRAHP